MARRNPIQAGIDWNRARVRAEQLALAIDTLAQTQPQVTGVEIDKNDPIEFRATEMLMRKHPGKYGFFGNGARVNHMLFGLNQKFGSGPNALGHARESGMLMTSGTRAGNDWFDRERRLRFGKGSGL